MPISSVVVAVLTYRRPADLATVLPMLQAEVAKVAGLVAVSLLVVDNDPDGGARSAVTGRDGVRYVHEPRPGIAAARNRALTEATGCDVLVFVDDDERPEGGWLATLLATWEAHRGSGASPVSGVVGPVVSTFAVELDPWVAAGGFFDRRRLPTGTPVGVAATNNLLLDLVAVRAAGLTFDERLGLTGGSDTLFTRALVAAAGPLIWCDEAVVHDVVPAARCTRGWVLRRQLRSGNSWSRTSLMLAPSASGRVLLRTRLTAAGAARLGGGGLRWLSGVLTGRRADRAGGVRNLARGLGLVLGAVGYGYAEYRR